MQKVTYGEALNQALTEEMKRNDKVVLIGEDIAEHGGSFQVTKDLLKKFGPVLDKVKPSPVKPDESLERAVIENIRYTVMLIQRESELIRRYVNESKVKIVGAYYSFESGKVEVIDNN